MGSRVWLRRGPAGPCHVTDTALLLYVPGGLVTF
jgi:hypothetical protein